MTAFGGEGRKDCDYSKDLEESDCVHVIFVGRLISIFFKCKQGPFGKYTNSVVGCRMDAQIGWGRPTNCGITVWLNLTGPQKHDNIVQKKESSS